MKNLRGGQMNRYNVWISREQYFFCENIEAESEAEAKEIAYDIEMNGDALPLDNDRCEIYQVIRND